MRKEVEKIKEELKEGKERWKKEKKEMMKDVEKIKTLEREFGKVKGQKEIIEKRRR